MTNNSFILFFALLLLSCVFGQKPQRTVANWYQNNHDAAQSRVSPISVKHTDFYIKNSTNPYTEHSSLIVDANSNRLFFITEASDGVKRTLVSVDLSQNNNNKNLQTIVEIPDKYQPSYVLGFSNAPVVDKSGNLYIARENRQTRAKTLLKINTVTKSITPIFETNNNNGGEDLIGELLYIENLNALLVLTREYMCCISADNGKLIWKENSSAYYWKVLQAEVNVAIVKTNFVMLKVNVTNGNILQQVDCFATGDWTLTNTYLFVENYRDKYIQTLAYDRNTLQLISIPTPFYLKRNDGVMFNLCSNFVSLQNNVIAALCRISDVANEYYSVGFSFNPQKGQFQMNWSNPIKSSVCSFSITSDVSLNNFVATCDVGILMIDGVKGIPVKQTNALPFFSIFLEDLLTVHGWNGKTYITGSDDKNKSVVVLAQQIE